MKQHDLAARRLNRRRLGGLLRAFLATAAVGMSAALMTWLLAAGIVMLLSGRTAGAAEAARAPADYSETEARLGIKIVGLRRSSAGYMLDFRYRVIDPDKALQLLDRKINPYLLDEASGAKLGVPDAPKVGQLRPTSRNKVIPGRDYYILFANPGRYLTAGSKVSLVAGKVRIAQLTVE